MIRPVMEPPEGPAASHRVWLKYPAAALLAGALLASGCANASTTSPTASPSAPGASDPPGPPAPGSPGTPPADGLVLRWVRTGGFAGTGGPGTFPPFSLYGDGRVVVPGQTRNALPEPREYRLTPAAVRRVVAAARTAGLERSRTLGRRDVADAFTLVITFTAGGRTATTTVVHPEGTNDPAVTFWQTLNMASWPRQEIASGPRPYEPQRLAVLATPAGAAGGKAEKWPLGDLGKGAQVGGQRCAVYSGGDRDTARDGAEKATTGTRWSSGDTAYRVVLRPLLPDERDCASLK